MVYFTLMIAAWVFIIAWLVRGTANRWIKGLTVAVAAGLTAIFVMPTIVGAKGNARAVEQERQAQEQSANALLRDSRHSRR